MILSFRQFAYLRPASMASALAMLQDNRGKAKILAGGTDLLVQMGRDLLQPECLVSLRDLPLNFIREESNGVSIGSTTRISQLAESELLRDKFTALWEAARTIGAIQVRNWGTLGGNLCNAAPSADTAPPLLAMGASITALSTEGERRISVEEFFTGPGKTILKPEEVMVSVYLPFLEPGTSTAYVKFRRSTEDIALAGVAVLLKVGEDSTVVDLRVALGAVAPVPVRANAAEELAHGSRVEDLDLEELSNLAVSATQPIDDVRAKADYRRSLVKVLTKRAIILAVERSSQVKTGGEVDGR